jgi:hypothetical protein
MKKVPKNLKTITLKLESSNLDKMVYNVAKKALKVTFTNGQLYQYSGVPWELVEGVIYSDSAGKAFQTIKNGGFIYEKV